MVISGVYKITNNESGKFYIGSSKDADNRKVEHWNALRRGNHINPILQNSWNFHGEDKFTFQVIEECEDGKCLLREQFYLDTLQPFKGIGYNINTKALGGDCFTNHPRKEEIREKLRIMALGENNGMFGKKHSEESLELLKEKAKGRYSLAWFIERTGEELGKQKYQERRQMLANRKINYIHDNGRKGKKVKVEVDRGTKVSAGRKALKVRMPQFLLDLKNEFMTNKQIAEEYGISVNAVKYHRNKKPSKKRALY